MFGTISIRGARDSSERTTATGNTAVWSSAGNIISEKPVGERLAAQDDDTIRLTFSSGNIAKIVYAVYSKSGS